MKPDIPPPFVRLRDEDCASPLRFFSRCNIPVINSDWDDRWTGKRMQTLGRNEIAHGLAGCAIACSTDAGT